MSRVRILLLTWESPANMERYGTRSEDWPRSSIFYPVYGALKERGMEVSVRSVGKIARGYRRQWSMPNRWWSVYQDLPAVLGLFAHYDVVITWGTFGAALVAITSVSRRHNRKIAIFTYTNSVRRHRGAFRWIGQWLYEFGIRHCGRVIYMTKAHASEAVEKIGCDPNRVRHIPVGVDTKFFISKDSASDADVRPELRKIETAPFVVIAGDQLREESLIVAALEGMDVGLVRLTRNLYTEKYWQVWSKDYPRPFPVICIVNLSPKEVRYVYQHALCVLNLVDNSWQPAGWTVLTEGMACGVPVIMNSGLVTDEMSHYVSMNGKRPFILIESLDPLTARAHLQVLRDNPAAAWSIGQTARDFVEEHLDLEKTGDAVFSIIMSMVSE